MFKSVNVGDVVTSGGGSSSARARVTFKWLEVNMVRSKFDITTGKNNTGRSYPYIISVSKYERDQEVEHVEKLLRARFDIRFEYGNANRSENILAMYEATKHLRGEPCPSK